MDRAYHRFARMKTLPWWVLLLAVIVLYLIVKGGNLNQ